MSLPFACFVLVCFENCTNLRNQGGVFGHWDISSLNDLFLTRLSFLGGSEVDDGFWFILRLKIINLTLEPQDRNFCLFDNILVFDLLKLFLSSYVSP